MSRYVVTGCAGFIGSHLSETLLDDGHEVLGVDSFTDYYARSVKEGNVAQLHRREGFSLLEANLADGPLEELLKGASGVFHLAAQPGVRGSWGASFAIYLRDNLLVTQRVFEAASREGTRVVFASSSSVYGDAEAYPTSEDGPLHPVSPYGVTKASCEQLAHTFRASFGLDAIGLRYFTVYGPRQRPDMAFARIVRALADDTAFTVNGTGEQSRDFTFVKDAVAATRAVMDGPRTGRAAYNVGGGTEASLNDILDLCQRLSGRTLEVRYEAVAAGDVRRTAADTTRIRSDFGWEPRTTLRSGLAAQIDSAGMVTSSDGVDTPT